MIERNVQTDHIASTSNLGEVGWCSFHAGHKTMSRAALPATWFGDNLMRLEFIDF
jgi:hypothetical protein